MLGVLIVLSALLAAALILRPSLGGKPFGFAALFVLPVGAALMGVDAHVEHTKETSFCTSCQVMARHGRRLRGDDVSLLPASHYEGGGVPGARACFACHTTYTMYGDWAAKIRGARHVWHNYIGKVPEKLKLYQPYNNRECLHCHEGARRFEAGQA